MQKPIVAAVVAIGKNRELGYEGKLLWHIPDDLKRFKRLTLGHPLIIGRKTFESIVGYTGGPLPGRTNIIVTRNVEWSPQIYREPFSGNPVVVARTLEEGIEIAKQQPGSEEIHIGGGAEIYRQALPYITKLYLTLIDDSKDADSFFPEYAGLFTKKVFEEAHEWNGINYRWIDLERP